jgi:chromosome segregation ATPase
MQEKESDAPVAYPFETLRPAGSDPAPEKPKPNVALLLQEHLANLRDSLQRQEDLLRADSERRGDHLQAAFDSLMSAVATLQNEAKQLREAQGLTAERDALQAQRDALLAERAVDPLHQLQAELETGLQAELRAERVARERAEVERNEADTVVITLKAHADDLQAKLQLLADTVQRKDMELHHLREQVGKRDCEAELRYTAARSVMYSHKSGALGQARGRKALICLCDALQKRGEVAKFYRAKAKPELANEFEAPLLTAPDVVQSLLAAVQV